ncbi:MAG: hypothetical protein HQL23_00320 [Candidatus Omnitrophica bacterium]|nr:hypothetical protein [Candidatus Omnitrophota bacterium]
MKISFGLLMLLFWAGPALAQVPRLTNTKDYLLYIPQGVVVGRTYPLVAVFSKKPDAWAMIGAWKNVAETYKWLIYAEKNIKPEISSLSWESRRLAGTLKQIGHSYPVNPQKIIAAGFVEGATMAYALLFEQSALFRAVVIQGGAIPERYKSGHQARIRHWAVLIRRIKDNQEQATQADHQFLYDLGWKVKTIREGEDSIVPDTRDYMQAAQWIEEQWK